MTSGVPSGYEGYLQARHAQFEVPDSVVAGIVGLVTGSELRQSERIVVGFDSAVYAVTVLGHPDDLVIKIQRSDDAPLDQEVWALNEARKIGVPVPDVLHLGSVAHASESLKFVVETRVPGRSLAHLLPSLGVLERLHSFQQMGRMLARLHQRRVDGFWKRSPIGRWDFNTWEAVMASTIKSRRAEWKASDSFTATDAQRIFSLVARYGEEFPCRTPVLCHGDFLPEHVFFDHTGQVSGVIDFGMYFGGDPMSDLAVTRMALDDSDFEEVLRGYAPATASGQDFQLHLHLSLLTTQLGYLLHHLQLPGHPETAGYAAGLRSTLQWLDTNG